MRSHNDIGAGRMLPQLEGEDGDSRGESYQSCTSYPIASFSLSSDSMVEIAFQFSFLAAVWGVNSCLALHFQNHGSVDNFTKLITEFFRPRIRASINRHALLASGQSTFVLPGSPIRAIQVRPKQFTAHSSADSFAA